MHIRFVHKTLSFCKHFGTVCTEEIQIAKFCTEVFMMLKHLIIKLNIHELSSYVSLFTRNSITKPETCRITLNIVPCRSVTYYCLYRGSLMVGQPLSTSNPYFENYLDKVYPFEFEINEPTESNTFVSSLNLLLMIA